MAVENFKSTQILKTGNDMLQPFESHAKLRTQFFTVVPAVAGDANSIADLVELPYGRVRILPHESKIWGGIFGAGRTLALGHRAYAKDQNLTEAEALTAFAAGLDVSAATANLAWSTVMKYDIFSKKGVVLTAQVLGGTWPLGIALNGYVSYLVE